MPRPIIRAKVSVRGPHGAPSGPEMGGRLEPSAGYDHTMTRIDWAFLCELAYFDRHERLCVVGVVDRFVVPRLPLALHQVTMVARLVNVGFSDDFAMSVGVAPPALAEAQTPNELDVILELSGDYVLATLRDVPLSHEGIYGFRIAVGGQPPVTLEVPVLTASRSTSAELH